MSMRYNFWNVIDWINHQLLPQHPINWICDKYDNAGGFV